jgi:hypothetical protein
MIIINLGAIALAISGVVVFFSQIIRSLWGVNINDAKWSNKVWMRIVRVVVAVLAGLALYFGFAGSTALLFGGLVIKEWLQLVIILGVALPIGYFGKVAESLFVQFGKVSIPKLSDSVTEVVARKE